MKTPRAIRIGTRESALALYQANAVADKIREQGFRPEIVEIPSDGDVDLVTPLYEMGIQGIFTRSLDAALLQNRIDVAVHSMKDVPTKLAKGLMIGAMLIRGNPLDCLVLPSGRAGDDLSERRVIATSSLRRKTQWLHRHPHYRTENLRGNIQTRLQKLDESGWSGAIFAQAALERLNVTSHRFITLDWMLPSPAQGAIGLTCRSDDREIVEMCRAIDHTVTTTCVSAERDFLETLHGGCAVPIGAHATIENNRMHFRGNVFSLDAREFVEVDLHFSPGQMNGAGVEAAKVLIEKGADKIIRTFRPE